MRCRCIILLAGLVALPAWGQLAQISVTGRFDDNVGFARTQSDIVEDVSLDLAASWNWHRQEDVSDSRDIGLTISHEHFARTENFDQTVLDLSYRLNRKIGLGLGWQKPVISAAVNVGALYSEETFRTGIPFGVGVSARSRLANGITLSSRLNWSGFEPNTNYEPPPGSTLSGDPWRWRQLSLGANMAMGLSDRLALALDLSVVDGDLVFTAAPTPVLTASADATGPDHALGVSAYAYRISGKAGQAELTLAYFLNANQQLELSIGRLLAESRVNLGYDRSWLRLSWARGF